MCQKLPLLGLLLGLLASACAPQPGLPAPRPPATARELRDLVLHHDYEEAYLRGRASGFAPEARAWWIAAMAAEGMDEEARDSAEALARAHPLDPWSDFARAYVRARTPGRADEALAPARRARAAAPANPDMAWLLASVLLENRSYAQVRALVDSVAGGGSGAPLSARLLAARGRAELAGTWSRARDTAAWNRALATAREAARLDSLDFDGWALMAECFEAEPNGPAALDAVRRLLATSPLSTEAHRLYWDALRSHADGEAARAGILTDAQALLRARPDHPGVLLAAARLARALGLDARRDSLEALLLASFPDSYPAERLRMDAIQRLGSPLGAPPLPDSTRAVLRSLLQEFVARPAHHSAALLGDAYTTLYALLRDDATVPGPELVRAIEGMARYQARMPGVVNTAPLLLAERDLALDLAERLAREIPARAGYPPVQPRGGVRYPEADDARAAMHEALGWVFFRRGRLTDAQDELEQALALRPPGAAALLRLGQVQEALGKPDEAERSYAAGYGAERAGPQHPNEAALRRLLLARDGSLQRFDSLVASLDDRERVQRRGRILEARLPRPLPVPPFTLRDLEGGTVSSDSLRGRVVVINFWGVWCGPCVAENHQLQKVHERYRGRRDVLFLTLDSGDEPARIRDYLAREKLDFPVLLDDGYAERAGVRGYPTTWFLDRSGRIAFYAFDGHRDQRLPEEYDWRIQALLAPLPPD